MKGGVKDMMTKEERETQMAIERLKTQMEQQATFSGGVKPAFGACPQCNLLHPPLRPGEMCPNASVVNKEGKKIDFEKFLVDMKFMLISQFELKKIENPEEVFKNIKIETMKILERFKK
jgi:hypothetical protein